MRAVFFFLTFHIAVFSIAQNNASDTLIKKNKNWPSIGFTVSQFNHDFGMGSCITSPYFFKRHMAIRTSYSRNWFQHTDSLGTFVWTDYQNSRLGIVGVGGVILKHIRLYGEGGIINIFSFRSLSNRDGAIGGYGLIGFEFLFNENKNACYFIELGGSGTSLRADKLVGKPFIGQGFFINTGFRL
jgi:hypothetical protein